MAVTKLYLRDTQTEPGTGGAVYDLSKTQGTPATLGSGNTQSATFVEMLRFQMTVGGDIIGTTLDSSWNMNAVSAATLQWQFEWKRYDSAGNLVASLVTSGPWSVNGIQTTQHTSVPLTGWNVGDRLACLLMLRKTSGGGNRSVTLNVNDADSFGQADMVAAIVVTPGTASLVLTGYAPAITVSNNISVTPSAASLVLTGYAPSIILGTVLVPATASLVLTGYAPVVAVGGSVEVTPATASLVLTGYAPVVTVTANVLVTPITAALVLAGYAPSIILGTVLVPGTGALVVTGYAPTITLSNNVLVTPGTASLVLSPFAPAVTISSNVLVTPGVAALILTAFAPTVTVANPNQRSGRSLASVVDNRIYSFAADQRKLATALETRSLNSA